MVSNCMPVQNTSAIATRCTIEFGQFSEKVTFHGCPFLGGRGRVKNVMGGAGGIQGYAGNFFPKRTIS